VPFIMMQQLQPLSIIEAMQSQQAWIMSQQALSPDTQVMQTPSLVISHLHMPMVRLQQQTVMPFIMQQQLHMPVASIEQRFCIMLALILSSHEQVIFMPPVHFCILMVQRGTIIEFMVGGLAMVGIIAPLVIPVVVGGIMVIVIAELLGISLPRSAANVAPEAAAHEAQHNRVLPSGQSRQNESVFRAEPSNRIALPSK